ncbi:MAG: hypothetical protein KF802_02455 [Bdellovibrionaceae bacterium]|nr:hypothetical protein [Pseudobdellovibrionaceae bacterium]
MIRVTIGKKKHYMPMVVNLAERVYKSEDVSPLKKYYALFDKCPEAFIFAFDEQDKLVGYIISLPLIKEYFPQTIKSDYTEQDLTLDKVKPYTRGNNYVYLFSIVSDLKHKDRHAIFKALSKAYINQLRQLAIDGKYVMESSAVALSPIGQKICQIMRMQEVGVNPKGVVYHQPKFHKIFVDTKPEVKDMVRDNFVRHQKQEREKERLLAQKIPA